jgi:hypothetical protein
LTLDRRSRSRRDLAHATGTRLGQRASTGLVIPVNWTAELKK